MATPTWVYALQRFFRSWTWWNIKRLVRYWWQRRKQGWDDSETWSLDGEIAAFTLPRLRRFKELNNGYPPQFETPEEWDAVLDDMIYAMECCVRERDGCLELDDSMDWKRLDAGLAAFGAHFRNLWW